MSYRIFHKRGGGNAKTICCRHLWERLIKEEKLLANRKRRTKIKATKRRAPVRYNSSSIRR